VVKLAIKRLALSNPKPSSVAVPSCQLLIEARHLRSDDSKPGDLYVMVGGRSAKDTAMVVMISSSLSTSNLLQSSSSLEYNLRQAENLKFNKDLRKREPI
jgi:hypothetical protein